MATSLLLTGLLMSGLPAFEAPAGEYVEARTASVFAGACHYNGEYTTQGRRAVLGWSIERGLEMGVDLSGVQVVALVECDENLAELDAPRTSVVQVEGTPLQRELALSWLRREHGATLGDIVEIQERDDLYVDVDGDRFVVEANGVELSGDTMADRACCKMPFHVWYDPMQTVEGRLVGCPDTFTVDTTTLDWLIDRPGENNAFFGQFGV